MYLFYVARLAAAQQHQAGFGQTGAHSGKNFQQPRVVFLRREPPYMAKQNFVIRYAQLPAQQGAALRVAGGKAGRVNAVGQHGEGAFAKQHLPGFLAAGEAVGQACVEAAAHQLVQPAHQVRLIGSVVAVAHPHRDARPACHGVVKHAKAAVMAVDNAPLRVGGEQLAQFAQIAGQAIVLPHGHFVDIAA